MPVKLVGWSWGAWLSYIFAANYPALVEKLILVGSGPFEEKYAKKIMQTWLSRLSEKNIAKLCALNDSFVDPAVKDKDALFAQFGKLFERAEACDPINKKHEKIKVSFDIYQNVWGEVVELRHNKKLLKLASKIKCPVIAIHGDYDPHPFEGVEKPLSKNIKNFKFILLKNCGHKPWIERRAKEEFYKILKRELS